MYAAVLMLAITTGGESIDHGRRGCNGCNGGYAACSGYYGGGCSGYSGGCGGGYYRSGYYGSGYYAPGNAYGSGYFYAPQIVTRPMPDARQSFYFNPDQQQGAVVRVLVPTSDAEIWFDGASTKQRGMDRMFYSDRLENGKYSYTVKARWMENGRAVERERRVDVQAGQPVTVNFQSSPGDKLITPKTGDKLPRPQTDPLPKSDPLPKTEKKISPEN
jgi:uncharacterized protein (TIGR03000 family)